MSSGIASERRLYAHQLYLNNDISYMTDAVMKEKRYSLVGRQMGGRPGHTRGVVSSHTVMNRGARDVPDTQDSRTAERCLVHELDPVKDWRPSMLRTAPDNEGEGGENTHCT